MCGRYSLTHSAEQIAARFNVDVPGKITPRYNVAPTDEMPVVRSDGDEQTPKRAVANLRWGLIPFWADDTSMGYRMINARSETAANKPAFRAAFSRRRCLVVTDGFYEWVEKEGDKYPIRITVGDDGLGAFAGLWERWEGDDGEVIESYTILTTDADPVIQPLHDRMPVWAPKDHWDAWLFGDDGPEQVLDSMIEHFPAHRVGYRPVSRQLNRPGNEGPQLWEPERTEGLPSRRPSGPQPAT